MELLEIFGYFGALRAALALLAATWVRLVTWFEAYYAQHDADLTLAQCFFQCLAPRQQ